MATTSHLPHDAGELLEIRLLRREQRGTLEERDHSFEQRLTLAHDQDQCPIAPAVSPDRAAAEPRLDQLEHLSSLAILAHVKLRDKLKPDAERYIALHRDGERSFSVDVPWDVAVQPFLLIVRTRRVVTIVYVWSDVTMSSAGYSEFPANSRIYRQQGLTVSRRSEPSSRTALMGEQPNPWDRLQPQDATSRHRGAKPPRRCGLLGEISLLSPEYLLSVERRRFHSPPPDH